MFLKIFYFIVFSFFLSSLKALPSDNTNSPSNKCKNAVSPSESRNRIQKPTVELSSILALPIESLNLSTRACNALKKNNINLLGDLVQRTEEELLKVPGLGRKNLDKIKAILSKADLQLGLPIDDWPPDSEKSKAPVKEPSFQGEGIPETPVSMESHPVLAFPIESLGLSDRSYKGLKSIPINSIADLVQESEKELLKAPSIGEKSLDEIKAALSQLGLQLGMTVINWPPEPERLGVLAKEWSSKEVWMAIVPVSTPVSMESHPVLAFSIQSINLPTRLYNFLKNNKIKYVGDLVQITERELLSDPMLGKKSLAAIKAVLSQFGLQLGMIVTNWPPDSEKLEMLAKELSSNAESMPAFVLAPIISMELLPILALPIEHLVLSTHSQKILENDSEIEHLGDLVQMREADLLSMPSFGKKGLDEIKEMLSTIDLQLRMSVVNWPPEPEKLKNLEEQAKQIYYASSNRPLLTPREEKVLRMLFGIGKEKRHTVREAGYAFNLSEVRIKQIQMNALRKLYPLARHTFGMEAITSPLDPKYVVEELLKKLDHKKKQTPALSHSTKK